MKKILIDVSALTISIFALSLSLYQFSVKSVRMNLISTDVIKPNANLLQFGLAFQNHGDIHLLVSEIEIMEINYADNDADACSKGRLARPAQTIRPTGADWFQVKPGEFVVHSFQFDFSNPAAGRKHFCVRTEVHDIFGIKYESTSNMVSANVIMKGTDRIRFESSRFSEEAHNIARKNYIFGM